MKTEINLKEDWRTISYIADWLFISNLGRVRSDDHLVHMKHSDREYDCTRKMYYYKSNYQRCENNRGYLKISLVDHMIPIDFLVYKYFVDETVKEETQIFHKDGDYRNDCFYNLSLISEYKIQTDNKDEVFVPINDTRFLGRYEVSNKGTVRSLEWYSHGHIHSSKILKPYVTKEGYQVVYLISKLDGNSYSMPIHRLVAEEFIPNTDSKRCVNHKDFNPSNNNIENLEWCTQKENILYSSSQDRYKNIHGTEIKCIEDELIFKSTRDADRYYGYYDGKVYNSIYYRDGIVDGKHFVKL